MHLTKSSFHMKALGLVDHEMWFLLKFPEVNFATPCPITRWLSQNLIYLWKTTNGVGQQMALACTRWLIFSIFQFTKGKFQETNPFCYEMTECLGLLIYDFETVNEWCGKEWCGNYWCEKLALVACFLFKFSRNFTSRKFLDQPTEWFYMTQPIWSEIWVYSNSYWLAHFLNNQRQPSSGEGEVAKYWKS